MYEALAANKAYLTEMKKAAEANGKEIVKVMIKTCTDGKKSGGPTPPVQGETELRAIQREVIEQVRLFLAVRYPRLDNPKNTRLPYCRPTKMPENFRPTEVDGAKETAESDLKATLKEDCVRAIAFTHENAVFSEDQDVKTADPRVRIISRSSSREQ